MINKDFETMLGKSIPNLPEYEPDINLWGNISSSLVFDIELEKAIVELPSYSPNENLWSKISIGINSNHINPRIRIVKTLRIPVGIAASFLLVATIYFAFFNNNRGSISYTEEVSLEWQNNIETRNVNPEKLIQEICEKHTFLCENEEFKEKSDLLIRLNQNLEKINNEINMYGTSISLEKSRIKVENRKAQVVKELIKQIVS